MILAVLLALLVGLILGGLLVHRAAERRARAAWSAAALATLTDVSAADLKRILGHLPPWVRDAEFQKVRASRGDTRFFRRDALTPPCRLRG